MGNAAQFRLDIGRDLDLAEEQLEEVVVSLALQGLQGLVRTTPVDTGRARGNWFVTVGGVTAETTEQKDPSGAATIATGSAVVQSYESGEAWPSIHIQNNLPYIERLENGYSQQAPSGMVGITLANLKAQIS